MRSARSGSLRLTPEAVTAQSSRCRSPSRCSPSSWWERALCSPTARPEEGAGGGLVARVFLLGGVDKGADIADALAEHRVLAAHRQRHRPVGPRVPSPPAPDVSDRGDDRAPLALVEPG